MRLVRIEKGSGQKMKFRLMQENANIGDNYAVAVMDFDFSSLVRL